jgi:hypothetical protein
VTTDEITAMRAWVTATARNLSTLADMPSAAEIEALPDDRIREVVEQHYTGGLRLFRYCLKNGEQP